MACLSPMLIVPKGYDRWCLEEDGVLKERALILKDMPSQRKKLDECNFLYVDNSLERVLLTNPSLFF